MPRTVLIDDSSRFRAAARTVLEAAGYDLVAEASDGESGVALVTATTPDLALVEVTRRLVEAGFAGPIVLISSRDRSDFGSLVEASGASGFVPKAELSAESLAALP